MFSKKCVVVGDSKVGKTCLQLRYTTLEFPVQWEPTNFNLFEMKSRIGSIKLWDTGGMENFDRVRHKMYHAPDLFLVCFSVVVPRSFERVKEKVSGIQIPSPDPDANLNSFQWIPEITRHCPGTPYLLVGTQSDLQYDSSTIEELSKDDQKPISKDQGEELAKEINAVKYFECSALSKVCSSNSINSDDHKNLFFQEGTNEVFDEVIRQTMGPILSKCFIM